MSSALSQSQQVPQQHTDVLIIGAGISGISAACHLALHCQDRSFQIIESRADIGGTWDLFRYPGIRSDTDMSTFGFSFKPWARDQVFGGAADIKQYLQETIDDYQLQPRIQLGWRVVAAAWSSAERLWTIQLQSSTDPALTTVTCQFLFCGTGYYNYEKGYTPQFKDSGLYQGKVVQPQFWPTDLDYTDKKVLVIGSGATAMTLLPAMAPTANHVTLLQRSPTYVVARPSTDNLALVLKKILPLRWASAIVRAKTVLLGVYIHRLCKVNPAKAKAMFIGQVRKALQPDFDVDKHFTPTYNPWEQRLCMVPDGDLFAALKSGKASIVTDHIEAFTPTGITLQSGSEIEADIVVMATGLEIKLLGDIPLTVDGAPFVLASSIGYKGVGYAGLPNFVATFGYTKASWTLKADLTSLYFCRLLNHMKQKRRAQFTPHPQDPAMATVPREHMSSGYFQRSLAAFPRQGTQKPWALNQAVIPDILALRFGAIDDGYLIFG